VVRAGSGLNASTPLPPIRLYLYRYGRSHANRSEQVQGQFDSRLTEHGQRKADELADFLADRDVAVYSTTVLRSYTTALSVTQRHGMKPTAVRDLKELDRGLGTGMQYEDIMDEIESSSIRGEDYTDLAT